MTAAMLRPITIIRADISAEEVADVLAVELGSQYSVSPRSTTRRGKGRRPPGAEEVVVEDRAQRARMAIVRLEWDGDQTVLTVRPGGFALDRLVNRFGVASQVIRVLRQSAELRMGA